jgi:hypothetical protein
MQRVLAKERVKLPEKIQLYARSAKVGAGGPARWLTQSTSRVFIDELRISGFQWFIVAMCFLVVVADGMDAAIIGFVTPPILQEWNISRPAFRFVISAARFVLVARVIRIGDRAS